MITNLFSNITDSTIKNTIKPVGGFDSELKKLRDFLNPILLKLKYKKNLFSISIPPLTIISGKHGVGKSSLVDTIIHEYIRSPYFVYYHVIQFELLLHRNIHTLQRYVSEVIQLARLNQPSIIVLENIDAVVTTDQQVCKSSSFFFSFHI